MKRAAACAVFALVQASAPVWADLSPPYHVSIDVSSLAFANFELELALYDNSDVLGDSWVFVDNVLLGGVPMADFESGTLDGFDGSLNTPGSVTVAGGSIDGAGTLLMRIDEDPIYLSTIAFRDFGGSAASILEFDLQMEASTTLGFWGLDEFVVNVLDPVWLDPLLPELPFGGILSLSAAGLQTADGVAATVIPAPGAALLGAIGLACTALARRRRAKSAVGCS